jgi:SMI1/KNR4 family protein SUKH-1
MLTRGFLAEFKRRTEENWSHSAINPNLYGFQFQQGTRWNPGLSDKEIAEYENVLSVRFPDDFKTFLEAMNGTTRATVNVYGHSGEQPRDATGVYSYPRDLEVIIKKIEDAKGYREELTITLAEQGFVLAAEARLVPIFAHRYVACVSNLDSSEVLSIADEHDAIVYGSSLEEYLEREFLGTPRHHKW